MNKILLIALCILYSQLAFAERLMPIEFIGQPVVLMDNGSPQSCGVRYTGVQTPVDLNDPNERMWIPDGSFMIDKRGYGLVKAIAYQSSIEDFQSKKIPLPQPFLSFWFKAENVKATVPITKVIQGDQQHSLLYATSGTSVLGLYGAILDGKPIQFAMKFADDTGDVAFFGTVKLKPEETAQLKSCMNELANEIEEDLKSEHTAK